MIKKFIKRFFYLLWTGSLQDIWVYLWSKTTIDEKTIAVAKETKSRAKAVGKALKGKK
jgi:hypothetical protein|tara:strand:+ start:2352 stop:2525 length:174 start_codon:yes stop_codon:yes gene_type:complete